MNAPPLQVQSRAEVREKLIFLIENRIQKGRMCLLYQLYQSEIHTLSLVGAAKIITTDLGLPIGIQTIRTLRKKSGIWEKEKRTKWERGEDIPFEERPGTGSGTESAAPPSIGRGLEGFKPLDVFSEEFIRQQSNIKWAQANKN